MQEKHLYEYAVIRIVPRVEREEFMNAGIILYSRSARFLNCLFNVDKERLYALCPNLNVDEVEQYLHSFENICCGKKSYSPIAQLDMASRFRWLTATRSTVVQTSRIHPGFCNSPQEALQHLHQQLVL